MWKGQHRIFRNFKIVENMSIIWENPSYIDGKSRQLSHFVPQRWNDLKRSVGAGMTLSPFKQLLKAQFFPEHLLS